MKVYLIIQGIIIGLMSAYSLGVTIKKTDEKTHDFEEMFWLIGKYTIKEQKRSVYKLSSLLWLIYVPYCVVAFIYFDGSLIPMLATILLAGVIISDFLNITRKIKKAQKITDLVGLNRSDRFSVFMNLILVAVQLGYII